jgi:hypothetical protein
MNDAPDSEPPTVPRKPPAELLEQMLVTDAPTRRVAAIAVRAAEEDVDANWTDD